MNASGDEVTVDSGDFVMFDSMLQDSRGYVRSIMDTAYSTGVSDRHSDGDEFAFECRHHVHLDRSNRVWPDGKVFMQGSSPGGCFTSGSHTHNGCSWRYTYHVHTSDCPYEAPGYRWVYDDNDDGEYNHGWHRKWFPGGYSCGKVPNAGQAWNCGFPVNSWAAGCRKTNASTVEYRAFRFIGNIKSCSADFDSTGVLSYASPDGQDILFDMGQLHDMADELDGLILRYREKAVDKFVEGCRARGNSHGITRTEYILHTHNNMCYENGTLVCAEIEDETPDGVKVWYDGGYSLHVHEGYASDGRISGYSDGTVLLQRLDPGGCFIPAGHEHDEECSHVHTDNCKFQCIPEKDDVYARTGPVTCPSCKQDTEAKLYKVSHACGITDDTWPVIVSCSGGCGYSDILPDDYADEDEFVADKKGDVLDSHEAFSCGSQEGTYSCNGQPDNKWELGCGKTTSDIESIE